MSTTDVNTKLPSLPELIARLQAAKFAIATSEVLDATRLLVKLAENNALLQADFLRDHLRPLLCKSTERQVQQQFDAIFQQWWGERYRVEVEPVPESVTPPEDPKQPKLRTVLLGILLLALILLYWQRHPQPELTETKPTPPIAEQITDVPKSIKPGPGSDITQAPAKPESPRIYGYWPAYRYTETLRPALAWLLVGAPLLLLLFFHLPAWALSRRRSGGGAGIMLKGWDRELAARRLLKPLTDEVASRFDWHIRGPAEEIRRWSRRPSIDVARTVSATLASIGIPRLRYRHARLHPEYLVLVEADHDDDFAMLWAERLKKQGLAVDLRRLIVPKDGSRPFWLKQQTGETGRFDNLPNPSFAQRLIVVSDGGFLLDEQGQWRDWTIAAQLQRWPVRALFSPKEPRDLLAGELKILDAAMRPGDPGFLVLPQEESALAAWSTWLTSGQMPVIVPAEAQRFPRLIAKQDEKRYLDDDAPNAAEVARLIAELHVYLGENGFYWLCCCAIPPLLHNGLTLLLGEEYLRRAGASDEDKLRYHLARNYRLLMRLPWLRHNQMPDWLRLALLLRLSLPLQEEMRDVVDGLLARQSPDAKGTLPLGFDAPAQAGVSAGAGGASQSTHHALYLGFMSGLSARQLQLRIPGPWQSWLNRMDSRPQSLRRCRDWLLAGFARLLFRDGLPENGAARFSLLAGWVMTGVSVVLLTAVAVLPPKDWSQGWSQTWREVLFVKGAEPLVFRHEGAVRGLAFNEAKPMLLSVSGDHVVQHWNIGTWALQEELADEFQGEMSTLKNEGLADVLSSDGRLMLVFTDEKTIQPVTTKQQKNLKELEDERKSKIDEMEKYNLVIKKGEIKIGDFDSKWHDPVWVNLREKINILDKQTSVIGKKIKKIIDNNNRINQLVSEPLRHEHKIVQAIFSLDGQQIATATEDGTVRLWNAQVGVIEGYSMRDKEDANLAPYSSDGKRTVKINGFNDETVRLLDTQANTLLGVLPAPGHIRKAVFYPHNDKVLIIHTGSNGEAKIWRIPPYPAPKPTFESMQNHLKTFVLFTILLALLLERASHIFSQHRLQQRLYYYAPGSNGKTAGQLRSAYEKFVNLMRLRRRAVKA